MFASCSTTEAAPSPALQNRATPRSRCLVRALHCAVEGQETAACASALADSLILRIVSAFCLC